MDELEKFYHEKKENIKKLGEDKAMQKLGVDFIAKTAENKYSYNFSWMGRPIIQFPQDMIAMQEIIWELKPDLIIETGIAHGGSIIYYASILELIGKGHILGIDIDIRKHNRDLIEAHPMFKRLTLLEGNSVSKKIISEVKKFAEGKETVMVCLDSNHTHEHVLSELKLYSPFVTKGSYLVVFDTIIEDMPKNIHYNRPWGIGNNPKTAIKEFQKINSDFISDKSIDNKLLISVAPEGYLKRIK